MTLNRPSALPLLLPVARRAQVSLARLWWLYNRQLVLRPVAARSCTAVVGLVTGDLLAQLSAGEQYEVTRSLRVAVYAGLVSGPVCYKFYSLLDKVVFPGAPTSWKAVVAKVLIDQLVFSPPLMCVYLSTMKLLEGCPHEAMETIHEKAIPCVKAGFAFWGPAHILNFRVVPDSSRTLAVVAFGVFWSAILSAVTAQKPQAMSHLDQSQLACTNGIKVMSWSSNT